uniref:Secreted protein n=1 Tax=Panagrolaimus davidi TaxID=227884 RepID=A0A914QWR5_9BILA
MFILYRIIISILNCYAIFIRCRTYVILKNYSEPMNVNNEIFENEKDGSEIVFFETPSQTRRHHLVASPVPYDSSRSPTRPVLFTNVV